MNGPEVDVVILTWNDGDLLRQAVDSAFSAEGVSVNVIVVDNGSDPPAECGPGIRLLRNEVNIGVARGRNQGVAAGSAELVCLLDSDARLEPATLSALVRPILDGSGVGLTAPVFTGLRPAESGGRAPGLARKLLRIAGLTNRYAPTGRSYGGAGNDVDFVIGACQVFPRRLWEDVGGIDETYFYGPEDVDFCLRIRRAGLRVVQVTNARCHHPPRRRNRQLLSRRGMRHARAVAYYLARRRTGRL